MFRTDANNNPAAFTTDLAKQAGLILGIDYEIGDKFPAPSNFITAKLIGDPIEITIRLINKVSYYTQQGLRRWDYIAIPSFIWNALDAGTKRDIIGFHYQHEGGSDMKNLFPNYGLK